MSIEVQKLSLIGEDERGQTFHIQNKRSGNFILAYRKVGSSSGRHYHRGKAAYKDPEILYLLSGSARIRWCGLSENVVREKVVQSPAKVIFPVNVWHELVAETDCSFWEMNSLEDVQKDSIRIEENKLDSIKNRINK